MAPARGMACGRAGNAGGNDQCSESHLTGRPLYRLSYRPLLPSAARAGGLAQARGARRRDLRL